MVIVNLLCGSPMWIYCVDLPICVDFPVRIVWVSFVDSSVLIGPFNNQWHTDEVIQ